MKYFNQLIVFLISLSITLGPAAAFAQEPMVRPALFPTYEDVMGMRIIGFTDLSANPCTTNSYERALAGASLLPPVLTKVDRKGHCALIRRGTKFAYIQVDSAQSVARFAGNVPTSMCTRWADGKMRYLPVQPPRTEPGSTGLMMWLMPPGPHVVIVHLFSRAPTGTCLNYERSVSFTATWPIAGGDWGYKKDLP